MSAQLLRHPSESGTRPGKLLARLVFVCSLMSLVAAAAQNNHQEPPQKPPPESAAQPVQNSGDANQPRRTVPQLTAELTRIKKRVADLEKNCQVDSLQDKLEKEQQHAETLHAQLLATMEKEAALQPRIDQIDEQLRPDNMDRSLAGVGSLHPEDDREALRRRLTGEKRRLQSQVDLLHQDHARLQAALADSDAAIQRLRLRLTEATHS